MTKQETMAIMAILREAYPLYYRDKTKDELTASVNLWASMFAEDDPRLVQSAIKAWIATDTKGFPPVIGQIKDQMRRLSEPEQMCENEAWDIVSRAIGDSNYGSAEQFEQLPTVIQKSVGSARQLQEWAQMDASDVQTVVASNFMRSYRVKIKHEQEYNALPADIKQMLGDLEEKQTELKKLTG